MLVCMCMHVCVHARVYVGARLCVCVYVSGLVVERAGKKTTLNAGRPTGGCYSHGSVMKYIFVLHSNYICSVSTL